MKSVLVASAFLTLAASAASASDTTSAQAVSQREAPAAAAPSAESERLVCRRVDTGSNSRLASRRVCRTPEQWRAEQRD